MNITIHRGTHQIGGSCIELSTETTRIIFDVGKELPPLTGKIPDNNHDTLNIASLFTSSQRQIDAVFISHYHGDHIGHIGDVLEGIPIFMGEKAAKIFNTTAQFTNSKAFVNSGKYLINGQEIKIGGISVVPYLVDHSAFDAYAFVISSQGKQVVYTGDLRAHGNKAEMMKVFLKQLPTKVDALIIEGTMMSRPTEQVKTEQQIGEEAETFMSIPDRPIFVVQASTNIDRLVQMYKAAKHSNRLFVMDIYTANVVSQLGSSIPNPHTFKDIRVFYPFHLTKRMFSQPDSDETMLKFSRYRISAEELSNRKDYCMLIRDSMLFDLKKRLGNIEGAGVIYSMWKGYMQTDRMQRLIDFCSLKNMEVVYLHTSGHADLETIKCIVKGCEPAKIIPVHTEYPERFADIFKNVIMVNDGQPTSI
jgi:ribonuclease J